MKEKMIKLYDFLNALDPTTRLRVLEMNDNGSLLPITEDPKIEALRILRLRCMDTTMYRVKEIRTLIRNNNSIVTFCLEITIEQA